MINWRRLNIWVMQTIGLTTKLRLALLAVLFVLLLATYWIDRPDPLLIAALLVLCVLQFYVSAVEEYWRQIGIPPMARWKQIARKYAAIALWGSVSGSVVAVLVVFFGSDDGQWGWKWNHLELLRNRRLLLLLGTSPGIIGCIIWREYTGHRSGDPHSRDATEEPLSVRVIRRLVTQVFYEGHVRFLITESQSATAMWLRVIEALAMWPLLCVRRRLRRGWMWIVVGMGLVAGILSGCAPPH